MILIIDNYDSFTYNLFQYLTQIYEGGVQVIRNDRITVPEVERLHPAGILISPGPGRPEEAGISVEIVRKLSEKIPILGVCLGHQVIGYAFGASIVRAHNIVHGKTDNISHDGKGLFRNIPSPARFTRYHSLAIARETLPSDFEITATSEDGEIMGIRHRELTTEGIQFHPESIASEYGKKVLQNFLNYRRESFRIPAILTHILSGKNLTESQSSSIMEEITAGELSHAQTAAVLTALNTKQVTSRELYGLASVLNKKKTGITHQGPLLDTCGTGGDASGTFNISSMAALVCSSCGAHVAKHGNRSVSSRSGSADFYERLGIPIDLPPEKASTLLSKTGFSFLFAPLYHPSMRWVAQVRREMGIKTVMNLLGPLVNPADVDYQLLGVYAEELCLPMAEASALLGRQHVLVIHSLDGLDEISVGAPTRIVEIDEEGNTKDYLFNPEDLGIPRFSSHELAGGSPEENASLAIELLNSEKNPAIREAVLLNAGAALFTCRRSESIKEGYLRAREALDKGLVYEKLNQIKKEGQAIAASD